MTAAELLVKCLEAEGVRYVFGVPGEENEDLLFALDSSAIRFIPTRHEQGAAFMADVWGRLTGSAGVCLSTLGPGATNLVTGVADAFLDKSPLVAITGQAGRARIHHESHQSIDTLALFRPITKWSASVSTPDTVPEIVRKAFKIAESEKPGATHIELPEDVAGLPASGAPIAPVRVRRPDPDTQAVAQAAALLGKAKRPLIIAGNGAVRKPATATQLRELVARHRLPVAHTFMGQGAISDDSPHSLCTIGFAFRDLVMDAVDEADVVLAVGYDLAEYAPRAWNPRNEKTIIHVDFTPADVDAFYQPAVELVADIAASLRALQQELGPQPLASDSSWSASVRRRILDDIRSYDLKDGERFTVPGVLNVLRAVMGEEDLLLSDVGAHKLWIARNFPVACPNGCLMSNGLASMGIALPGAVAAALHDPGRRIVAAMGDGGFLMNSQELETAKRLGTAFTVVIFNDNDYGLISWKQRRARGRATGTGLTNPDFRAYAESFGIRGYRPATLAELRWDLAEAVRSRALAVVEIPVDAGINDRLLCAGQQD